MSQMQPVRGTHDIFGDSMQAHRKVIETAKRLSEYYGFSEIRTPIFEFTPVFKKTLGDTSDIVTKEMYTFTDRGGDELCLRPEGTAGVMRHMISEGLFMSLPQKLFYEGPMFRYERPQKGRFRQFYQIGVELIGIDNPMSDVEVIHLGQYILNELGISDVVYLEINSIGDVESRKIYREKLVSYYQQFESALSEESKKRLQLNPMRILDSKDPKDIEINKNAPKLLESLNDSSRKKFDVIQKGLSDIGITFQLNDKLVRGLDYYSHIVFEFKTNALGAQDAVMSGGRYDGLSEMMGGRSTPPVGWAAGGERLALLLKDYKKTERPVALIGMGEAADSVLLKIAAHLREKEIPVEMTYSGNMSNRMKKAEKAKAKCAIIVGDSEIQNNKVTIKNLDSGQQSEVPFSDQEKDKLAESIRNILKS